VIRDITAVLHMFANGRDAHSPPFRLEIRAFRTPENNLE